MIKACILLVAAFAVVAQAGHGPKPVSWIVNALPANQVPTPITNSKLTSQVKFTVDTKCNVMGTASVKNVIAFTEAHLHMGTAAMNGNVALIIWIPQTVTQPLTGSFSWAFSQNITDIMKTEFGQDPANVNLSPTALCAQWLNVLTATGMYYNVHTVANAEGEARGQVHKA